MKLIIEIDKDLYESIAGKNSDHVEPRQIVRSFQATIAAAIAEGIPYNPTGDLISREALKGVIETYRPALIYNNKTDMKNRMVDYFLDEIDNAQAVCGNDPGGARGVYRKASVKAQDHKAASDMKKTFDGHVIGEIIVDEGGIYKVIDTGDEKCYSMTTIMPRETFVEAYNKYIKGEAVEERPQDDYISHSILDEIWQLYKDYQPNLATEVIEFGNALEKLIDNAPTVDLWQMRQEATENAMKKAEVLYGRPQGEWMNHRNDYGHNIADCSLCGKTMQWHDEDGDGIPRYCWYCGADMRGGAE